jgi:hypothetical protein
MLRNHNRFKLRNFTSYILGLRLIISIWQFEHKYDLHIRLSHMHTRLHDTNTFRGFRLTGKYLGSLYIVHVSETIISQFKLRRSLTSSNICVRSCGYIYLLIAKLIVVFRSRSGNVAFDLDYKAGDYHNKTNHIIICVLP